MVAKSWFTLEESSILVHMIDSNFLKRLTLCYTLPQLYIETAHEKKIALQTASNNKTYQNTSRRYWKQEKLYVVCFNDVFRVE